MGCSEAAQWWREVCQVSPQLMAGEERATQSHSQPVNLLLELIISADKLTL